LVTPRRVALFASALLTLVALFFLRPVPTPGPPMRDFEAYYAAGKTWALGGNPYSREVWRTERTIPGVVATRDELLPFVGPPFSLPLWAALAALPFRTAVLLWGAVLTLAAGAVAFGSLHLGRGKDAASYAGAALLAVSFGPLTSAVALGQAALVACAGVVLTAVALRAGRARSAIAAALAAALQPNVGIALVARLTSLRAWFAIGVAAAIALAASVAAVGGLAGFDAYLAALARHADAERSILIQTTLASVAFGFGASQLAAREIGVAVAAIVIGITAWILRERGFAPESRVAVACAVLPLVLPFSHEHDLAVTFLPAVLCLRRARRALWIAAACATVVVAVDWLGLAQRPTGVAQSAVLALSAGLAATALSRGRLFPGALAPLAVAATVALAGPAIAQHAVHVWPDALGATFSAPQTLDAAGVWQLEQERSGLAAPAALPAALRMCSLAGCAALWATSLAALRKPEDAA
jgi:hypothetical protein